MRPDVRIGGTGRTGRTAVAPGAAAGPPGRVFGGGAGRPEERRSGKAQGVVAYADWMRFTPVPTKRSLALAAGIHHAVKWAL